MLHPDIIAQVTFIEISLLCWLSYLWILQCSMQQRSIMSHTWTQSAGCIMYRVDQPEEPKARILSMRLVIVDFESSAGPHICFLLHFFPVTSKNVQHKLRWVSRSPWLKWPIDKHLLLTWRIVEISLWSCIFLSQLKIISLFRHLWYPCYEVNYFQRTAYQSWGWIRFYTYVLFRFKLKIIRSNVVPVKNTSLMYISCNWMWWTIN